MRNSRHSIRFTVFILVFTPFSSHSFAASPALFVLFTLLPHASARTSNHQYCRPPLCFPSSVLRFAHSFGRPIRPSMPSLLFQYKNAVAFFSFCHSLEMYSRTRFPAQNYLPANCIHSRAHTHTPYTHTWVCAVPAKQFIYFRVVYAIRHVLVGWQSHGKRNEPHIESRMASTYAWNRVCVCGERVHRQTRILLFIVLFHLYYSHSVLNSASEYEAAKQHRIILKSKNLRALPIDSNLTLHARLYVCLCVCVCVSLSAESRRIANSRMYARALV